MLKLRPYEERAVAELQQRFKKHRRVLGVAPTGSGKTVIAAAFVQQHVRGRVLWLAHRIELVRQAYWQLLDAGMEASEVGILSGVEKRNVNARVLIASVPMFARHPVPNVSLFVVDEAHHVAASSYRDIVEVKADAKVLGLTATPWRLDGEALGDVFDDLCVMAKPGELIVGGFIMEAVVYGISQEKATELAGEVKGSGKDYSAQKLDKAMRKHPLMADIIHEWFRLSEGRPTIVYACSLEHAKEILKRFRIAGVTAEYLNWSTPADEREAMLGTPQKSGRLSSGETKVVVNLGILTEGIDCPPVKCIVIARPTKSLTLYRQMCGRGSRPDGEQRPLVHDHAGNVWRHGLPDAEQEWSLEGHAKANGVAPVKQCEACGCISALGCKKCPQCGQVFPCEPKELSEQSAKLERIKWTADYRQRREAVLREIATTRGLDEEWVQRVLAEAEAA
jgi:DNA repair protein RadD